MFQSLSRLRLILSYCMIAGIPLMLLALYAWHVRSLPVMSFVLNGARLLAVSAVLVLAWLLVVRLRKTRSRHDDPANAALRAEALDLLSGTRQPIDAAAAEPMLRRAYENGDRLAGIALFMLLGRRAGEEAARECRALWQDCEPALRDAQRRGNIEAKYLICWVYAGALDRPATRRFVERNLAVCCNAEYPLAMSLLGYLEESGLLGEPDLGWAMHWYEKAAALDSPRGLSGMGRILTNPAYAGHDFQRGRELLEQAAKRGDSLAMLRLGELHEEGGAGDANPPLAREWYEKAVAQELPLALPKLATLLQEGRGGPVDRAGAERLLERERTMAGKLMYEAELRQAARGRRLSLIGLAVFPLLAILMFSIWSYDRSMLESSHDEPANISLRQQAIAMRYGVDRPVDLDGAEHSLREAWRHGDKLAALQLMTMLHEQPGERAEREAQRLWGDCDPAWQELLDERNIEAMTFYVQALRQFLDYKPNHEAFQDMLPWLSRKGYLPALLLYGDSILDGTLEEGGLDEAMLAFEQAAAQGSICGTGGMGRVYCDPQYSGYDPEQGRRLLELAAGEGDSKSAQALAALD